jgi:2-amino-4-hydroxy-6-hydroxymethyldihydropteridine diphosphokinase
MTRVLLAVGANLGDREATLAETLAALSRLPHAQLLSRSAWHETAPVGGPVGQPGFLNGAVLLSTSLSPHGLASELRQIETELGRERHTRWDARKIDIDLLLFGEQTSQSTDLEIPHPRMAFRRFVLDPACEIAGEMVHPPIGWALAALQRHWHVSPRSVTVQSTNSQLAAWLKNELTRELAAGARDPHATEEIRLVPADHESAMVIVLDDTKATSGPVVRITATDPAVILQEALAAIHAAWPD